MNVIALKYFVETVRLASFTAAAQSLGVSQSTVSKMIKNLETELGEVLIVRSGRPLLLSDAGQVLYEKGAELLQALHSLKKDIHAIQALEQGRLKIGIPPMVNLLFTEVVKEFREQYPSMDLAISEPPGPAIEQLVAKNELDLGFSIAPVDQHLALRHEVVASYAVYAIARSELLPRNKGPLTLHSLHKKPLLLLNDDFALTRLLRQRFHQAALNPTIYAQSSQWDWLLSMAQAGLGIALLPEPFCARLPADLVHSVIEEPVPLLWEVALLWNGRYLSHAARAWLESCQRHMEGDWLHEAMEQLSQ